LCDGCGEKCFYDSNLNWEFGTRKDPIPKDELVRGTNVRLDYCGDMAALCRNCAKNFEVIIVPLEE